MENIFCKTSDMAKHDRTQMSADALRQLAKVFDYFANTCREAADVMSKDGIPSIGITGMKTFHEVTRPFLDRLNVAITVGLKRAQLPSGIAGDKTGREILFEGIEEAAEDINAMQTDELQLQNEYRKENVDAVNKPKRKRSKK